MVVRPRYSGSLSIACQISPQSRSVRRIPSRYNEYAQNALHPYRAVDPYKTGGQLSHQLTHDKYR